VREKEREVENGGRSVEIVAVGERYRLSRGVCVVHGCGFRGIGLRLGAHEGFVETDIGFVAEDR
jgi:hypothetical protein